MVVTVHINDRVRGLQILLFIAEKQTINTCIVKSCIRNVYWDFFLIKNSSDVIPGCVNVDILAYLASIGAFNQYKVRAMGGIVVSGCSIVYIYMIFTLHTLYYSAHNVDKPNSEIKYSVKSNVHIYEYRMLTLLLPNIS